MLLDFTAPGLTEFSEAGEVPEARGGSLVVVPTPDRRPSREPVEV